MAPSFVHNFKTAWEEVGVHHEIVETFQLGAVTNVKGKYIYSSSKDPSN
jgi:hypothetical protein